MLCYRFPHKVALLAVLRFPAQSGLFCTMWFKQFTKNVTKTGHIDRSHPHSTEHDTQPIASSRSISDTWWHMLSWGVYSQDSVLSI
jgi:hypothetical protein